MEEYLKDKLGLESITASGKLQEGLNDTGEMYITNQGKIFVKSGTPEEADTRFKGEMESLSTIEKTGTVRVPHPINVLPGPDDTGYIFVMEYLELEHLSTKSAQLGEDLAKLHLYNINLGKNQSEEYVSTFGFDVPTYCGKSLQQNLRNDNWGAFFTEKVEGQMKLLKSDTKASQLWQKLKPNIPRFFKGINIKPSLLHGELMGQNVAQVSDRPVVFDAASFYGHHEFDLAMTGMFGGFNAEFYQAYHKLIPRENGFEFRHELYQLFNYLNHWNQFGQGYRSQSITLMEKLLKVRSKSHTAKASKDMMALYRQNSRGSMPKGVFRNMSPRSSCGQDKRGLVIDDKKSDALSPTHGGSSPLSAIKNLAASRRPSSPLLKSKKTKEMPSDWNPLIQKQGFLNKKAKHSESVAKMEFIIQGNYMVYVGKSKKKMLCLHKSQRASVRKGRQPAEFSLYSTHYGSSKYRRYVFIAEDMKERDDWVDKLNRQTLEMLTVKVEFQRDKKSSGEAVSTSMQIEYGSRIEQVIYQALKFADVKKLYENIIPEEYELVLKDKKKPIPNNDFIDSFEGTDPVFCLVRSPKLIYLKIIEARKLPGSDVRPYCTVTLNANPELRKQTQTHKKTLNPKWDEVISFSLQEIPIEEKDWDSLAISISVFDWNRFGKDSSMGKADIQLKMIPEDTKVAKWYSVERMGHDSCGSQIRISIRYFTPSYIFSKPNFQFGIDINALPVDLIPGYRVGIPKILVTLTHKLIEKEGLDVQGIFRLAPEEMEVNRVKIELNKGNFQDCDDVNCLAHLIKVWCRELPEPLLGDMQVIKLIDSTSTHTPETVEAVLKVIKDPALTVLEWILDLCIKVCAKQKTNLMSPKNMAVVFGPNFIPKNKDPLVEMRHCSAVQGFLIPAIKYRQDHPSDPSLKPKELPRRKAKRFNASHSQSMEIYRNSLTETKTTTTITTTTTTTATTVESYETSINSVKY